MSRRIRADAMASFLEAPGACKQLQGFGFRLEHALGHGIELARERGKLDPAAAAQEELGPIGFFELPDMVRNCWLSERQPAGGFGKAAVGGNGMEGLQLGVAHGWL